MFPESKPRKKQRQSEISPLEMVILTVLVLGLGAALGGGFLFLRNIDRISAQINPQPTATLGPTNTPTIAPTATAMPDFSGIEIGIWELPVGFSELPDDEIGATADGAVIEAALGFAINSRFGYQKSEENAGQTILVGYTFVLPSATEQAQFDHYLKEKPEIFEAALHPVGDWLKKTQPEEEFLRKVAESHTYWSFIRGPEQEAQKIHMIVFRRRGLGAVLYSTNPYRTLPGVDIYAAADLLDQQVITVLKQGNMSTSSTTANPDDLLETLQKAEKRFAAAKALTYQLNAWHTPRGGQTIIMGHSANPYDMQLTYTESSGYQYKLRPGSTTQESFIEHVSINYLTVVDLEELHAGLNIIVNSAARLSRQPERLQRHADELIGDNDCYVYSGEIDMDASHGLALITGFIADVDKEYDQVSTATVWIDSSNLIIRKARFSLPYHMENDLSQTGVLEMEVLFTAFH